MLEYFRYNACNLGKRRVGLVSKTLSFLRLKQGEEDRNRLTLPKEMSFAARNAADRESDWPKRSESASIALAGYCW